MAHDGLQTVTQMEFQEQFRRAGPSKVVEFDADQLILEQALSQVALAERDFNGKKRRPVVVMDILDGTMRLSTWDNEIFRSVLIPCRTTRQTGTEVRGSLTLPHEALQVIAKQVDSFWRLEGGYLYNSPTRLNLYIPNYPFDFESWYTPELVAAERLSDFALVADAVRLVAPFAGRGKAMGLVFSSDGSILSHGLNWAARASRHPEQFNDLTIPGKHGTLLAATARFMESAPFINETAGHTSVFDAVHRLAWKTSSAQKNDWNSLFQWDDHGSIGLELIREELGSILAMASIAAPDPGAVVRLRTDTEAPGELFFDVVEGSIGEMAGRVSFTCSNPHPQAELWLSIQPLLKCVYLMTGHSITLRLAKTESSNTLHLRDKLSGMQFDFMMDSAKPSTSKILTPPRRPRRRTRSN